MKNIRLIFINIDNVEIDRTFTIEQLVEDFWNECMYVPANDDEIELVEIDGVNVIDSIEKENDIMVFLDVVKYLGLDKLK